MKNRYVMTFTKEGYIKYTSHLDMLRLFKRAFKKCQIQLAYSQGFNPHPKMGFAQPLSLGYISRCELLEFETVSPYDREELQHMLNGVMPEGVEILACETLPAEGKSLASAVTEAIYKVTFPVESDAVYEDKLKAYLQQDEILAEKRQKKTKKLATVDIRSKIRAITVIPEDKLVLRMDLDCGSASNLSPELVISTFCAFARIDVNRYDIEVEREDIIFDKF